jgi:hypothetical protein
MVQWWLGQTPSALLVAPALALLAGLVYGASFVGQGLGADQMYFLRATLTRLCESSDPDGEGPQADGSSLLPGQGRQRRTLPR